MKTRRFAWEGAAKTARAVREWTAGPEPVLDVAAIGEDVLRGGDEAVLRLTARFDATQRAPQRLRVEAEQARAALGNLDSSLLEAMELAAENVRAVAEAQLIGAPGRIELAAGTLGDDSRGGGFGSRPLRARGARPPIRAAS